MGQPNDITLVAFHTFTPQRGSLYWTRYNLAFPSAQDGATMVP